MSVTDELANPAGGALSIQSPAKPVATVTGGAGASLTFTAASIDDDSQILAHGGAVGRDFDGVLKRGDGSVVVLYFQCRVSFFERRISRGGRLSGG